MNIAEAAHIYAFSTDGPRGNEGIEADKLNDLGNLILVCHDCHKKMDQENDGGRYAVDLLRKWKAAHERRVERVTGIDPTKSSHVVLYGANIGEHSSPLRFDEAAQALFPNHYPAEDRPIELGTKNSCFNDRSPDFWKIEAEQLKAMFDRKIRQRIETGDISHLSVFGFAPQPLLILFGSLMIDITRAEVFQRHREPRQAWDWPEDAVPLSFKVERPQSFDGPPAIVLAISAPVHDDRIKSVLGDQASIWKVSISRPHNDVVKCRQDLSRFRGLIRSLLDEIKVRHGQETPLHVFPAASVSISIEFGRVRMPKAHMPWVIYDQVNERGGFTRAIEIPPR